MAISQIISRFAGLPSYGLGGLVVLILYVLQSELRFGSSARTHRAGASDRSSTLVVSISAAVPVLGFVLAMKSSSSWVPHWFRAAVIPGMPLIAWVGVVLGALGLGLRLAAVLTLRERYTRTLLVQSQHDIERSGPYRWVRHPGYLGSLLCLNGIALASGNWMTLVASLLATVAAYSYRVKVEDEMLIDRFGPAYAGYRHQVGGLLPRLIGRRSLLFIGATSCLAPPSRAQVPTGALGPRESYSWGIRASHADELLLAVGDSVDIVLLRDRCREDAGLEDAGCWDASSFTVIPHWKVECPAIARVRAIKKRSWRFGRGTAGARIYGLQPGASAVTAVLPTGEIAFDSVRVIAAPGAVRIVLEPKPQTILAGDTVRFRVTARDSTGQIVAVLPVPAAWNVVGPPDKDGYAPVAFYPWESRGRLSARLGRLTDSLDLHFVPRVKQ